MAYGDKPKRQKDDMGNKGRRSGKGPKPMKGQKKTKVVDDMGNKGRGGKGPKPMNKAGRESAKQERKNLLTENPVVNRSKDSGFDYTQSKRDIKKKYKKGSDIKDAVSTSNMQSAVKNFIKDFNPVKRYQGVTKKLGNTTAMSAMMSGALKKGLSAQLSKGLTSPTMRPTKSTAPAIKQPLVKQITKAPLDPKFKVAPAKAPAPTKFTPSKRDMELKEAHLGTPPQQSADPAKLTYKKAGGPVKPKDKKAKRKKRTIKLKA